MQPNSRFWAREDGTFDAAADLGLIQHDGRYVDFDEGDLCLWGEAHVVYHDGSRLHVQNIHTQVSKQIALNFQTKNHHGHNKWTSTCLRI